VEARLRNKRPRPQQEVEEGNSAEPEAEEEWPAEGVKAVRGNWVLIEWKPTWVGVTN
jgi:hypothetical protein